MKNYEVAISLTILIFFSTLSLSDGDKSTNTRTLNVPAAMAGDILSILMNGTVRLLGNCTAKFNSSLVQYWLYTQVNNPNGELMIGVGNADLSKPVIILIHGWLGNKNVDYIIAIRNAYLQRYDANVIVVDYGPYANLSFFSSNCYAPDVARNVANFVCLLKSVLQISISSIHIVGHSLGGQIAGLAGSDIQTTCSDIVGRITALDPGGPLFQGVSPNNRLDKSDAIFVDVVHTDQGMLGYIGPLGHVDFYPNGGSIQPGCPSILKNLTFVSTLTVDALKSYAASFINCNHQRSCYLFAESININSFYSTSVLECTGICVPDLMSPSHCYMGENLREPPEGTDNQFTCTTNAVPKYGLGPDGPMT